MTVQIYKTKSQLVVHPNGQRIDNIVKSIPGYGWSKTTNAWTFPLDPIAARELLVQLHRETVPVKLFPDAEEWYRASVNRILLASHARTAPDVKLRAAFADRMYLFQRRGTGFLLAAKRALLTDEMGLGKTVEAIAAIEEHRLESGSITALIVCNKGMLHAWKREIEGWTGQDATILTHCRELVGRGTPPGYYIINWSKLRVRDAKLTKVPWTEIVGDESHRAKNRKSQQTKALWRLHAPHKYALTGTPVRNDVTDLWAQLHWLDPARFPSYWKFFDQFADWDMEWVGVREVKRVRGVANEKELSEVLKSIMYGRKIADVEIELPPVVGPKKIVVELEGEQLTAYRRMEEEFVAWIESEPDEQVLARNWIAQLIRLKQIAGALGIHWDGHDESAKFDAYEELVDEAGNDEKWVCYSQYTTVLDELEKRLQRRGEAYAVFTGPKSYVHGPNRGLVKMDRGGVVEAFQRNSSVRHFIASIGAGGEGLTLTAARRMVLLDLPWTPAEIEQAHRRIIRIGQKRSVFLYHIMAKDTVDFVTILPTIKRKQDIIDIVTRHSAT